MPRPNPIPREMHSWVCEEYLAGMSLSHLSKTLTSVLGKPVGRGPIESVLVMNGIQLRTKEEVYALREKANAMKPKKKYDGIDQQKLADQIVALYKSGKSLDEISAAVKNEFSVSVYPKEIKQILASSDCELRSKEERYRLARSKVNRTCLERYGSVCSLASKDVKEKAEQTLLKKYGATNAFAADEIKAKIKQTSLCRYGVENPAQASCVKEKAKQTCQERFGKDYFVQTEDFQKKATQTSMQHFGVEHPMQSDLCKEKSKQTCMDRYGVEWPFQAESVKAQVKATCLSTYGVENVMQSEIIKEKVRNTNLNRYGTPCVLNAPAVKAKIRATLLERYGVENILQSRSVQERIKLANIERYGVENVFAAAEIREKIKQTMFSRYGCYHAPSWKFVVDEMSFDSFPEVCFYLYWKFAGKTPIREGLRYEYECGGKKHWYYPDFVVDGQAYEIKGNQFLAEDGTWRNPYDHSQDEEYEAKRQCAIDNGVKILYNDDYEKYVDWFYGSGLRIDGLRRRQEKCQ